MAEELVSIVRYEVIDIIKGGRAKWNISTEDGSICGHAPKGAGYIAGERIRELYIDESKQPPELYVRFKEGPGNERFGLGVVENVEEMKKILPEVNKLYSKDKQ